MSGKAYRADVDGLRAVAVGSVLLYHVGLFYPRLSAFSGGYVGVDVFFVISGFLITGIIARQLDSGTFSLPRFFEARARRIVPALLATIAAAAVAAWYLFMPVPMESFGESALAAALFVSNILFWTESGYFDADPVSKPLLHTWSLSVEWQFYVFLPLFMLTLARAFRSLTAGLVVLALASFAASVWFVGRDPSGAFYGSPFRVWEFLCGSAVALGWFPTTERRWLSAGTCLAGLGLIGWSVSTYTKETAFPGLFALAPVVGAAMVIQGGGIANAASGLLGSLPLRFIGWISYSLYLVHWPLLVFTRRFLMREPTGSEIVAAIAVIFAMAIVSWWFVERPFRDRAMWRPVKAAIAAACVGIPLLAFGAAAAMSGLPERLPQTVLAYAAGAADGNPRRKNCSNLPPDQILSGRLCVLGSGPPAQPTFLLWGDSHADALMPAFEKLADDYGFQGRIVTYGACPPLLGVSVAGRTEEAHPCRRTNDGALAYIKQERIRNVVLVSAWNAHINRLPLVDDESQEAAGGKEPSHVWSEVWARGLDRTFKALSELGVNTWVVAQVPEPHFLVPDALANAALVGGDPEALTVPIDKAGLVTSTSAFDMLARKYTFRRIEMTEPFCAAAGCVIGAEGQSLFVDGEHLSEFGARWVSPALTPIFESFKKTL